jgi:hypothetical protein
MQIAAVFSSQLALRGTSPPARTEQLLASDPPGPYGIGSDTWPGLATLAADAAQVVEVVSAIIGNGNDTGPDAARLRESLQDQLGDLRAAIDYVISKNALDWNAVNRRRDRQRSRYERDHRPTPPPQPAARSARHAPPDQAATGNSSPGPHDQGAGQTWPVPRQHARLSRSAPARSARRPARARAATPSSPSSAD